MKYKGKSKVILILILTPHSKRFYSTNGNQRNPRWLRNFWRRLLKSFASRKRWGFRTAFERAIYFPLFINDLHVGLKTCQKNKIMQSLFNEYKAVTYMFQRFSKTKDQCSQSIEKRKSRKYLRTTFIIMIPRKKLTKLV